MSQTMKAVRYHEYGGSDRLAIEAVAKPEPARGDVLIKIHAASVNPIDWKIRAGMLREMIPVSLPVIPGEDVAGTVEAVGGEVSDLRPGDAVFAMTSVQTLGGYAEFVAVERAAVALKPRSLDFVQAAAVPMGALTAWQGVVEHGGLQSGSRLFVHGAAGNVGGMAVQIARALGAVVTAAASSGSRATVEQYGADRVVDYGAERFEDVVHDMDIVFDTLGGDFQARSWSMLKPGGILVSTVGIADPGRAEALGVRATGFGATPNGAQLARVAEMIDAGQVRPRVAQVLPLAEAAKAQDLSQDGKAKGKIVLTVA